MVTKMPWNPFSRTGPTMAIPRQNAMRLNTAAINLNRNLRVYVNAYSKARNANNGAAIPPLNSKVVNALKKYINAKRPRAAGAAAAAVNNAGGSNNNAAAAAAGAANASGSSPANVGAAAAKPLLALGAPPNQAAAAAAGAAKQQALALGQGSNAANAAGAKAAANAANAATPQQAANAAASGAAAAGLPPNNQAQAAEAAAANELPSGTGGVNINTLRGAIGQNVNAMNAARARQEKLRLNVILKKFGNVPNNMRNQVNNYRRRLNNKIGGVAAAPGVNVAGPRNEGLVPGVPAPQMQEKTIKAPNGRNIVVVRANNKARWNFKNAANKAKYNLNNRNKNTPTIRNLNLNTSSLFPQGN